MFLTTKQNYLEINEKTIQKITRYVEMEQLTSEY